MKPLLCGIALFALSSLTASAVSISIDAEVLLDAGGSPMPQSGLVVLTAAAEGVFNGPSGSNFTTGSEMFLASWDLSFWGMEGVFSGFADLPFSGEWNTGDSLRIYWYPTLTLGSTGPSEGIPFGFYSDSAGIDGSNRWITPNETDSLSLRFFTSDASFLGTGSNDPEAGLASQVVPAGGLAASVPDSGGTMILLALGLVGVFTVRRLQLGLRRA